MNLLEAKVGTSYLNLFSIIIAEKFDEKCMDCLLDKLIIRD